MNIVSQIIQKHSKRPILGTILFAFFLWVAALVFRTIKGLDDFDVFFHAGKRISLGEDIYGLPYFNHLKFYYSPLFALLLSPWANYPILWVKTCWFFLNYACLLRCVFILKQYTNWGFKGSPYLLILILFCSGKIVLHNFLANQLTVFILWTLLESFHLYKQGKSVWAIIVFCIGLNFKILSIVVLPFYFLMKNMRYKSLFVFVTLVLLLIPAIWLSWNYNLFLLERWWAGINPTDKFHVVQTSERGFLDISSLVTRYLSSAKIDNEPPINIGNLSFETIFVLTNGLRIVLLSMTIIVMKNLKKPLPYVHIDLARIAAFVALIPVLLPHQRDYSFLLDIPMLLILSLLIYSLKNRWLNVFLIGFVGVSGLLSWSFWAGKGFVELFYSYRLITIGMLGIFLLYLYVVNKIQKNNILISA